MALVAHYDLELPKMDVKTTFLNGGLHEDVYMTQPEGFMVKGKEHMFKKNAVDQCIYLKMSGSKFVILVLYVDDIILASNDLNMLDRSRGISGFSQMAYIDKILKKYNMENYSPTVSLVVKSDKFGAYQYPKNKLEQEEMRLKPYASVVGHLRYVQACTHPDIAYIMGILGHYQSNLGKEH
nr:hypothetical protein [Tanacetum cinerariifolium]